MAGSRTLKLSILGDVDNLNKSLKSASGDVDGFGDKVGKTGAKIGAAFAAAAAAAGAAAIAIGIEGVKAAIEDEKAQTQLALALENATGATKAQIAETEKSILQMSLATGVADDDLRPALGRLVRSTGDTTKAQALLAQALDISAATGKPLETVSAALAKGFEGNTTALGKLGIGLSAAELKTMSFEQVQGRLTDLFGGAAAANADTYAGKIARVQVAFGEAKETLGQALLPILDKLLTFINKNALPAIEAFTNAFSLTGSDGFGKAISDVSVVVKNTVQPIFEGIKSVFEKVRDAIIANKDNFKSFGDVIAFVAPIIGRALGDSLEMVGKLAGIVINIIGKVLGAIKPLINFAIDGINLIIKGYNLIPFVDNIALIPKIGEFGSSAAGAAGFSGTTPGGTSFTTGGGTAGTGTGTSTGTGTGTGSSTGIGTGSGSGGGTTVKPKIVVPVFDAARAGMTSGGISAQDVYDAARAGMTSGGSTINLTVNGAIDKEGTARTIIDTLNNSFYRGTGGAGNLQFVT
jgi:phage-related protein